MDTFAFIHISAFLADLVDSYFFEKAKYKFHLIKDHVINRDDGMVVFTGERNTKEVRDWLNEFQQTINESKGNQHLQFTAEIWTTKKNSPTLAKYEIFQSVTDDEFPFLDMKISWSPQGDLQFNVFRNKVQKLKYVGKEITQTTGTLRAIPSEALNHLDKLTSRKPSVHSEGVDKIYPNYANALCKAGLALSNFLTMGDLWSKQDENMDMEI